MGQEYVRMAGISVEIPVNTDPRALTGYYSADDWKRSSDSVALSTFIADPKTGKSVERAGVTITVFSTIAQESQP